MDLLLDPWRLRVVGDPGLVAGVTAVMVPPCAVDVASPGADWTIRVERDEHDQLQGDVDALFADRPVLAFPHGGPRLAVVGAGNGLLRLLGRYRPGSAAAPLEVDRARRTTRVVVWRWLAGDVTLVDVIADCGPTVRGGTSAILGRRGAVRRWFPDLDLPEAGPDIVDLRRCYTVTAGPGRVPVVAAVLVSMNADPFAAGGVLERVDRHTAATAWLRTSGHLLDRLLDAGEEPLRMLEDEHAQRQRIRYAHALTSSVGFYAVHGTPHDIASRVEQLFEGRWSA